MQLPGAPSLLFLIVVLVLLPLGARRTALRLTGAAPGPPVSRELYWRSAVLLQLVMFVLAWITGGSFCYEFFAVPHVTVTDAVLSGGALALCYGIRAVSRAMRSEEELKALSVYKRAPRTSREQALFVGAVVAASVSEETVYRGVGMSILWYSLGNPWLAAAVMATAFALAHWNQGWKSGLTILLFALVMHGLVALTDTLVFAMGVHLLYDLIVGHQIRLAARKYD